MANGNRVDAAALWREAGHQRTFAATRLMMANAPSDARQASLEAANGSFSAALDALGETGDGVQIEQIREARVEALFAAARYHASHVERGGAELGATGTLAADYRHAIDAAREYGLVARSQTIARNGIDAMTRIGRAIQSRAARGQEGAAERSRGQSYVRFAAGLRR